MKIEAQRDLHHACSSPDLTCTDPIQISLVQTNVLTRWPCDVCGGCTDKVSVLAEGIDERGNTVRVCETCLKDGDIDRRLKEHADRLAWAVANCRSLIGRLKVPTYAEWKAGVKKVDDEYERLAALEEAKANPSPPSPKTSPRIPWRNRINDMDVFDSMRALLDQGVDLDDREAVERVLINPHGGHDPEIAARFVNWCIKAAKANKAVGGLQKEGLAKTGFVPPEFDVAA
jgi:hypothetical protein